MVLSLSIEAGEIFHPSTLAVFGDCCLGVLSTSDDEGGIVRYSTGHSNNVGQYKNNISNIFYRVLYLSSNPAFVVFPVINSVVLLLEDGSPPSR